MPKWPLNPKKASALLLDVGSSSIEWASSFMYLQ